MSDLTLGLVAYANTALFRYGLRELNQCRWIEAVPASLLPLLEAGEVEAAILPSVDAFAHPEFAVLSGSCIACHGRAESVQIFSRIPLRDVTTVALDSSSHTSAALARILLRLQGYRPSYLYLPPDLAAMLAAADAALLIGDPCMRAQRAGLLVTDLGEQWRELTGLPFVFALWAARPGLDCGHLEALIAEAKGIGLSNLERVAEEESRRSGLGRDQCLAYLRDRMKYDLDDRARAGLERFRELAVEQELIPDGGPLGIELATRG